MHWGPTICIEAGFHIEKILITWIFQSRNLSGFQACGLVWPARLLGTEKNIPFICDEPVVPKKGYQQKPKCDSILRDTTLVSRGMVTLRQNKNLLGGIWLLFKSGWDQAKGFECIPPRRGDRENRGTKKTPDKNIGHY